MATSDDGQHVQRAGQGQHPIAPQPDRQDDRDDEQAEEQRMQDIGPVAGLLEQVREVAVAVERGDQR